MYGIVLWSDRSERQAVIWCEDQGDLAYCRQTTEHGLIFDQWFQTRAPGINGRP